MAPDVASTKPDRRRARSSRDELGAGAGRDHRRCSRRRGIEVVARDPLGPGARQPRHGRPPRPRRRRARPPISPSPTSCRRLVRLRPAPGDRRAAAARPRARRALPAGARRVAAIALRTVDADELGVVVDAARKGEPHVGLGPAPRARPARSRSRALDDRTADVLTAREREVLVLLAEGRTNREIAAALSVTLATVKSHLVRIYAKLEASNRNEALGRAVALGSAPVAHARNAPARACDAVPPPEFLHLSCSLRPMR